MFFPWVKKRATALECSAGITSAQVPGFKKKSLSLPFLCMDATHQAKCGQSHKDRDEVPCRAPVACGCLPLYCPFTVAQSIRARDWCAHIYHTRRYAMETEKPADAFWDRLADEHVFCLLRHLGAGDLMRVSMVDRRFRCIALDECLWKALYIAAFPPCPTRCLATAGESVVGVDIAAIVNAGMDRMLDPTWAATECVIELPLAVRALGDMDSVPLATCPHHWPDVLYARGYRWAYAVAMVDSPRLFGPHLDGSPACLVGRSQGWRGDLTKWPCGPMGHGFATVDSMNPCSWKRQWDPVRLQSVSGQFSHGRPAGRVVAWCHRVQSARCNERDWCTGFYQGTMTGAGPHGVGVLIGPTKGSAGRTQFGHNRVLSVIRCGAWQDGRPVAGNRTWSVLGHREQAQAAGIGYCTGDTENSGIVRTFNGKVAFLGTVKSWEVVTGRFMSGDATVVYEGCARIALAADDDGDINNAIKNRQRTRCSTLFIRDGRVADLAGWRGAWDGGSAPQSRQDAGPPTVIMTYANGDRMHWRGNPASPAEFVFADGRRLCRPPLGWNLVAHCAPTTLSGGAEPRARTRLLIQDTPFALPAGHAALSHEYVDGVVFWPRLSTADDARLYVDFMDHMAACHGPQWVRCRAAVRLLWGLDGPAHSP
nr:F-box domain protein [Pandoravirus massiliensis]